MIPCSCEEEHVSRRIVLTGGPGAGKTAVLEMLRKSLCAHMTILPEAAGILFGGGFPRSTSLEARRAAQRAIFFVQRELEATTKDLNVAIVLCDRGTVDGAAYWPGPDTLWESVGTRLDAEHGRYDTVIHLRTPADGAYNRQNPLRIESELEARAYDERIARAWDGHPRRFFVEPTPDFVVKASRAIDLIRAELPDCCARHLPASTGQ